MIQIDQLVKAYGPKTVLKIEHLEIAKGEVFGLVGNNGAGKTTLYSLMLDLIIANQGAVVINDIQVNESEEWKKFVGSFVSESFLIDFLTPEEYFKFIASLHNWNDADLTNFLKDYADFFNDEILGNKKFIRDLSKGNQKKVGIVGALIGDPEIIILDEPFANLDPSSQARLRKLIENLDFSEKTILISSHDLNHIAEVCTRIVVLEKGEIVKDIQKSEDALNELRTYFNVV